MLNVYMVPHEDEQLADCMDNSYCEMIEMTFRDEFEPERLKSKIKDVLQNFTSKKNSQNPLLAHSQINRVLKAFGKP